MDNVTRMYQAIVNLAIASKGHPEFEDVLSVDGDASEAQATAKIATVAVAVDALKKAGLTPAQYAADIEAVQKRLAAQMAAAGVGQ